MAGAIETSKASPWSGGAGGEGPGWSEGARAGEERAEFAARQHRTLVA